MVELGSGLILAPGPHCGAASGRRRLGLGGHGGGWCGCGIGGATAGLVRVVEQASVANQASVGNQACHIATKQHQWRRNETLSCMPLRSFLHLRCRRWRGSPSGPPPKSSRCPACWPSCPTSSLTRLRPWTTSEAPPGSITTRGGAPTTGLGGGGAAAAAAQHTHSA